MDYGTRPRDPAIPAPSGRSLDDPWAPSVRRPPASSRRGRARSTWMGSWGGSLFPLQGAWLPFEALAESRVDGGGTSDPDRHELEEVVNYVLEGTVIHPDTRACAGAARTVPWLGCPTRSARRHDILATVEVHHPVDLAQRATAQGHREPAHPFVPRPHIPGGPTIRAGRRPARGGRFRHRLLRRPRGLRSPVHFRTDERDPGRGSPGGR